MHKHHISIKHAFDGVRTALQTQPNFRVHISFSILVIVLGLYFQLSRIEWLILVLTISIGLAVELLNTAIEFTVDLLTSQYHLLAKYAKDTAAAAMLVYALFATVLGLIIFLPKIIPYLTLLWLSI